MDDGILVEFSMKLFLKNSKELEWYSTIYINVCKSTYIMIHRKHGYEKLSFEDSTLRHNRLWMIVSVLVPYRTYYYLYVDCVSFPAYFCTVHVESWVFLPTKTVFLGVSRRGCHVSYTLSSDNNNNLVKGIELRFGLKRNHVEIWYQY